MQGTKTPIQFVCDKLDITVAASLISMSRSLDYEVEAAVAYRHVGSARRRKAAPSALHLLQGRFMSDAGIGVGGGGGVEEGFRTGRTGSGGLYRVTVKTRGSRTEQGRPLCLLCSAIWGCSSNGLRLDTWVLICLGKEQKWRVG
jgi:hypothetical protein